MNDRTTDGAPEIPDAGRPWTFDGDPDLFRLAAEAYRIRLAALFDPLLAVHTSHLDPLPHQITAVYETLLSRQPLRFVLADDPGAGKTVMAGLLIKELRMRGDVRRCLIVCPGNLVEQWRDELARRFSLPFEIVPPDAARAARTGPWFAEHPLSICRLDTLSRNDALQATLETTDWDLIVCDEAHKMSASFWGGEVHRTGRYRLGQRLSALTRHFLLLTATPHNGREEDFQLFLALIDPDRFEGRFRAGVHSVDASDLMRRMVKEDLLTFDGRPLFPERRAYTASYTLSEDEADLYRGVTEYVRGEFDRADRLAHDGRKRTVGFALTVLQRRLASSPEAIYQSLRRRTARLEQRCRDAERQRRAGDALGWGHDVPRLSEADLADLDDAPDEELADAEARVVDRASAARTIAELEAEIASLRHLTAAALRVRTARLDRKWDELSRLLQTPLFAGRPRKLIVFTEHRDTLTYLQERVGTLLGRPGAVAVIHGGLGRDARREVQARFTQDKAVTVLLATDAAGEGINLQRAHLMVNYDLPWNPNRLEQRFGRIHRIGQTEVCHCWNLVASGTREGAVYRRLLEKLDEARKALGGKVFDVLGRLTFNDAPLRHLLLEAVRYGDRPEVRARLDRRVARALDRDALRALIDTRALVPAGLDAARIREIRDRMDRAAARRLQPHFVAAFFIEAFGRLGGSLREREPKRYEAGHVPAVVRGDRAPHDPILPRYERLTFDKDRVDVPGKPVAEFVCPGHPLLDATLAIILERHGALLERGTTLIDDADPGGETRTLVALEHTIREEGTDRGGTRRPVSRQVRFVEIRRNGAAAAAGPAPYLDYRSPTASERRRLSAVLPDVPRAAVEAAALRHAAERLVPAHLHDVRTRRARHVDKTAAAVRERLTAEISHWDHRAEHLKQQEAAGRPNAKITSARARQRADDLAARLDRRMDELARERRVASLPPTVVGGALIVPAGLLAARAGDSEPAAVVRDTRRVEMVAMRAVLEHERARGFAPRDVSAEKCGYDVESRDPARQRLRFIEVKGRVTGADTVTCTKNEILTALNEPDRFLLALVEVEGDAARTLTYVPRPFGREPDFGAASVTYKLADLLARPGCVEVHP